MVKNISVIRGDGIGIGNGIFYNCNQLEEIVFEGTAPDIGESAFLAVDAAVHYPASLYGWTADFLQAYGGSIVWQPYGMTQLKITHETIAAHLGTAREVVTRMLKYFQTEGVVQLSRGTVEITNLHRLSLLSE